MRLACLVLGAMLCGVAPVAAQWDDENAPPDTGTSDSFLGIGGKSDDTEGSSGGGFLGGLFGGGILESFDGKFLDTVDSANRQRQPFSDPSRSGLQIALREGEGSDSIPAPLPALEDYAEGILTRLLISTGISGISPKIIVVPKGQIHGAAFPDGSIFLPLGAYRNFETEDELAALLAHEVSHIILNHHSSDWFLASQERGLAAFELALEMKSKFEQQFDKRGGGSKWDRMKMELIAQSVVFASDVFIDSAFTRAQEDQADILGVDLLIAAGYSPLGMSEMLEDLVTQEAKNLEEAKRAEEERQRALGEKIEREGIMTGFTTLFKEAGNAVKSGLRDAFGKRHRDATERQETVLKYIDREYPDADDVTEPLDGWNAVRQHPSVVAALDGYRAAMDARDSIATQQYDDAVSHLNTAFAALPGEHALPRIVAAELAAVAGDDAQATRFYRQSLKAESPPLSAFVGLAELLRRDGQHDESAAVLTKASRVLEDAPQLLPDWINYAKGVTDVSARSTRALTVNGYLARCKLDGVKTVFKQCRRASEGTFGRLGKVQPPAAIIVAKAGLALLGREFVRIARPKVNARGGPGQSHAVVGAFSQGTPLMVLRAEGDWIEVRDTGGAQSWVARWLTEPASNDQARIFIPAAAGPTARAMRPSVQSPRMPAAAAPPRTQAQDDVAARLKRLDRLKAQGLITDTEYNAKRTEILDSL